MKKYIVKLKSDDSVIGTFDTKIKASEFVTKAVDDNQIDTVFDVVCEEKEINDHPKTYEDACDLLGHAPEAFEVLNAHPDLSKAVVAFYKLCIIANAWNKIDGFVPDFSNENQYKHYPWFVYKTPHAGFVYASADYAASLTNANVGSRLCFKSPETAREFGMRFIGLYNEMFL